MNQLALYWGTKVYFYDRDQGVSTDDLIEDIKGFLIEKGDLQKGDVFINTLSMPVSKQRKTNTVKLSVVE